MRARARGEGTRGTGEQRSSCEEIRREYEFGAGTSDLLKTIIEQTVQLVLEPKMEEALQAGKGERSENRLGYRSGYYG